MVFTNDGKNRLRDLFDNDVSYGEVGSGTTEASVADSALEAPITGTDNAVTTTKIDKQVTVSYPLPSTEANGETITEFGVFGGGGNLYSRFVFDGLLKDASEEWELVVVYRVV